jgi:hypothetical protein
MTEETTPTEEVQPEVEAEQKNETDAPATPERSPLADLFEQTFEGVKYETLTPEQREAMYQYLIKTQAGQADTSSETPVSEKLASENMERFATLTVDQIDAAVTKAEGDGDFSLLRDVLRTVYGTVQELPGWFNGALSSLGGTVSDLQMDREMTAAIRKVPDATDADVEMARRIHKDKEAGSLVAALQLAVFRRSQSQPKRQADPERKRKAVAADDAARGSDPTGRPMSRFPQTQEEWRDLMMRQAREGKLITG